jgi:hypothetical protein
MSMRIRLSLAAGVAAVVLTSVGCHGITTPSSNANETFSGTLQKGGVNQHQFSASKTGEMIAKLTAWGPNNGLLVGIEWVVANNDGTCTNSVIQVNNFAALNAQAVGGSIVSGRYCIVIYDVGTLTAAQTYSISVSHP